jgi:hypothetical protein
MSAHNHLDEMREAVRLGTGSDPGAPATLAARLYALLVTVYSNLTGFTAGTGAASKAVVLDASGNITLPGTVDIAGNTQLDGNTLAVEGGAGVVGDAETYATGVTKVGGLFITRILIDLTGLDSSGTGGDIIGDLAGGPAHLGQITAARNGTIVGGRITCLEVPTGGDPDVDFWAADEATGAFDDAVSGLTGEAQLVNTGDWTLETDTMTAFPAANQHLYAVAGATDDATYTAGKFLIELYGV